MDRHQVDGIERLDNGIRDITGQVIDIVSHARHRRVPAVLEPPHEAAHLLEILPSLDHARAPQLGRVRAVVQHSVEQLGRWETVDQGSPFHQADARLFEHPSIVVPELSDRCGRLGCQQRLRQLPGQGQQRRIGQPHEP